MVLMLVLFFVDFVEGSVCGERYLVFVGYVLFFRSREREWDIFGREGRGASYVG